MTTIYVDMVNTNEDLERLSKALSTSKLFTRIPPWTYVNGSGQRFKGIELEAKRFLTQNWHVLGSLMYQNNEEDAELNPSVVLENMIKFGTAYTWDWGSAAIFYSYFGEPPKIASPLIVNPEPEEINLVSMNIRLDTSKWMVLDKGQSIFTFRAENLLDEEIYVPTFAFTGSPNSFPYGPDATFYGGLTINF